MDSKTKAAKILAELTEWVEMHGEQVDWTVFREECDGLLSSAFRAVAPLSAFPVTSYGRGVCTLELACSGLITVEREG